MLVWLKALVFPPTSCHVLPSLVQHWTWNGTVPLVQLTITRPACGVILVSFGCCVAAPQGRTAKPAKRPGPSFAAKGRRERKLKNALDSPRIGIFLPTMAKTLSSQRALHTLGISMVRRLAG